MGVKYSLDTNTQEIVNKIKLCHKKDSLLDFSCQRWN